MQYTFGGSKRRVPLGALTLALARSAAAKILGDVAQGLDPAADRKAAALEAKAQGRACCADPRGAASTSGAPCVSPTSARATRAEAVRAIKVAFAKQSALAGRRP